MFVSDKPGTRFRHARRRRSSSARRRSARHGGSHSPPHSPDGGRRTSSSLPSRSTSTATASTARGGFFVLGAGIVARRASAARARQRVTSGQRAQPGARGVHTVAPSSIIAWLKSPARAPPSARTSSPARAPHALLQRRVVGRAGERIDAREHAHDVAVDDRRRLAERDAGDGAGRVRADARAARAAPPPSTETRRRTWPTTSRAAACRLRARA